MKNLLLTLTIALITVNTLSQTDCTISDEYGGIFKIKKKKFGDQEFLFKTINEIDKKSCFSELVNNNGQYIDYLLNHFSDKSNYEVLLDIDDTTELQNEFIKFLEKDSQFNNEMNKLAARIMDKSNYIPDTISFDELLNIAVKYFSILKINKDGYYIGRVCTGINGLKQTEKERKPQVEAFCFTTILNNYKGDQFSMYDEFVKGIGELYKINLGLDDDERILRAQGAMYMFMKNNDKLKELLMIEYENKKEYLPFVVERK